MMRLAHVIFIGLALLFVNYYIATHMLIVGLRGSLDYSYAFVLAGGAVSVNLLVVWYMITLTRKPVDALAVLPLDLVGWRCLIAWAHLVLIYWVDVVLIASSVELLERMPLDPEDPAGYLMLTHSACLLLAYTTGLSALAHGLQSKLVKWLNPEASEK